MKKLLMIAGVLGIVVASTSVSYYYVILLPQQNAQTQQDISAIRGAVAPTPEQQKTQQAEFQQAMSQMNAAMNTYMECEKQMQSKRDAYLKQQCPSSGDMVNMLKEMVCRSKATQSDAYKQYNCPSPF